MSIVRFNIGGSQPITVSATTGTNLTVVLNGREFTTAGQGTAADTATLFVNQYKVLLAEQFGVYTSSSSTTLTLNGVKDIYITVSSGGSLGSADKTTEYGVDYNFMLQYAVASATQITFNLNASSFPTASDVMTIDFLSESDRNNFIPFLQKILESQENGKAFMESPVVCSAVLS